MIEAEGLVFGLYKSEASVEYAMCHLRNVGFLDGNFSIVFPSPQIDSPTMTGDGFSEWSEEMIRTFCEKDILLSVRCETSGQAAIARKILECTEADSVLCSGEQNSRIQFPTGKFSSLA